MNLLIDQDGGGGCDSSKREEIITRLTRLETKSHCPDHDGFISKLDTLDGKVTSLTIINTIALELQHHGDELLGYLFRPPQRSRCYRTDARAMVVAD